MKKILFGFMSIMLCGFISQAQFSGTVTGQVVDSLQQPVPGVAVFFYGTTLEHGGQHSSTPGLTVDKTNYKNYTYTNGNGQYSLNYYMPSNIDTVVVGALDCNQNVSFAINSPSSSSPNYTANLSIGCVPTSCDAVLRVDSMPWNPGGPSMFEYTAVSLIDSGYGSGPLNVTHTWSYNGQRRNGGMLNYGPNQDTIWLFSYTNPGQVCYQRDSSACAPVCVGTSTPTPTSHSCNADFFVDSVNSINFQGQIVVWENSTTDTGATIIGYRWDFGDGSPIVNQQYPSHTYADTGVYEVCLSIVSVMQTATTLDTCVSTHCDSIGFDSQGNLIYKSSGAPGFTINVVDPATVGQSEFDLSSNFKLFPNPNAGKSTLSWSESIVVDKIEILSINGEYVRSMNIDGNNSHMNIESLQTGMYMIHIISDHGSTALKMIVK